MECGYCSMTLLDDVTVFALNIHRLDCRGVEKLDSKVVIRLDRRLRADLVSVA